MNFNDDFSNIVISLFTGIENNKDKKRDFNDKKRDFNDNLMIILKIILKI